MLHLPGVTAALLTPFTPDGEIDHEGMRNQVDFIASHCEAVAVLGAGVSEYQTLVPSEREELLVDIVRYVKQTHPKLQVVAGISSPAEKETLSLADRAESEGADYLQLLIPQRPWGGEARADEIVEYFTRLVPKLPLPVVAYHHPGLGSDPTLSTLEQICKLEGVVAFKDSSRNASRTLMAVRRLQHELRVSYLATIQPATLALLAGAAGVMTPPPFTMLAREIIDHCNGSEAAALRELASITTLAPTELCSENGLLPGALEALRALGVTSHTHASPYDGAHGLFDEIEPSAQNWYRTRLRGHVGTTDS